MKRLTIILAGVFLVAASAVQHFRITNADLESEFPTLATNGEQVAMAWMDGRDGNQEIYFRMVDPNTGALGVEQRLTTAWTWDDHPRLCWTGSEFGLSYIHESRIKFDLMFMRFTPEGKPKGPALGIIRQAMLGKDTAITWTGAGYGLVATEFRAGAELGDLVYRFVDETGKQQGPATTLVSATRGALIPSALFRSGSDFALFYLEEAAQAGYLLRLDPFGKPKGKPQRLNLTDTQADLPAAAFNGKIFVCAWTQRANQGEQVMLRTLSAEGVPLGDPFPITEPGLKRPAVGVAAGPDEFGVAYLEIASEGKTLNLMRLDATGKPKGAPVRLSPPRPVIIMSHRLAMTADSKGYLIAWVDLASNTNSEVILTRVGF